MNAFQLPVFVLPEKLESASAAQTVPEAHSNRLPPTIRRLHLAFVAPAVGVAQKEHSSAAK